MGRGGTHVVKTGMWAETAKATIADPLAEKVAISRNRKAAEQNTRKEVATAEIYYKKVAKKSQTAEIYYKKAAEKSQPQN
jgi:hypothetical protein